MPGGNFFHEAYILCTRLVRTIFHGEGGSKDMFCLTLPPQPEHFLILVSLTNTTFHLSEGDRTERLPSSRGSLNCETSRLSSDEVAFLFLMDWLGFLPAFPHGVSTEDMFG